MNKNKEQELIKAMEMYNFICETENDLAMGERVFDLDENAMNKAKDHSKDLISKELGIKVK